MKIPRRRFIEVVGASVASFSIPNFAASGLAAEGSATLERAGWRLEVTPAGKIASFTDGKTELTNGRLGNDRPRVVVGGMRLYDCERPSVARQKDSRLIFRYDFAGRDSFSVNYELELVDLPPSLVTLKQKVGIEAAKKINENVKLMLPRNLQLPYERRKVFLPLKNGGGSRFWDSRARTSTCTRWRGVTRGWGSRRRSRFPWWMNTLTRRICA